MAQALSLRMFLICMFSCASLVLLFIWNGGPFSEAWFKVAATLFVVGLAAFLVWFSAALVVIRDYLRKEGN